MSSFTPLKFTTPPALRHCVGRQLFTGRSGQAVRTRGQGRVNWLRKLLSNEVKTAVRAIPMEATKAKWTGDRWGRAFVGGGCLFGIGSLCFYGLGLSNEIGAIDKAKFWPAMVRERVNKTYGFFAYGLTSTAVSAYVATRSSSLMRFMTARPMASLAVFFLGSIGSMMMVYSVPYAAETIPVKVGAFTIFSAIMGITLAPLIGIAGPLAARAAAYTAGVVGGLTLTAACAPSEKYLNMGGPLALGLGVVLVASVGGLFASPGGAVFSGLHTIYMYGGLVLFGGFMLYDTQKIIHHAENDHHYDPINRSMGIYLDTINIFIRILTLLAGSGNRKRK